MFKSIFAKYITAFMLIIVICFTILSTITGSMLVNYTTESQQSTIDGILLSLDRYFSELIKRNSVKDLSEYIEKNAASIQPSLRMFAKSSGDLTIFITDPDGVILLRDGEHNRYYKSDRISSDFVDQTHKKFSETTDFDGLFESKYLTVGLPLIASDEKGSFLGTFYVCSSYESLNELIRYIVKTIVMTSIWIMLAAMIAVYFITDKIIGPMKEMSVAAKSFAAGKFDERVPVLGHDEVAELAVAFNNMAASLADIENMRQTFLANVSHDLRTPMTTIAGFIDGILDGAIPPENQEHYLKIVSGEVKRLSRLVSSLLDLSRIQAGERKFVMSTFDICEMARLILISFENKINEKKLDVEFDCEKDNMFAYADKDAIYQVLYNICDNAVKFSKEGGKYRIRIVTHDKKIFVSVYNEGQGIKEDELPHVFDRFYKADKSRGLDKTGVGLGLYISKTIMDAHGEEIWVKSTYGEYCEFLFTLQKATSAQAKKAAEKQSEKQPEKQ